MTSARQQVMDLMARREAEEPLSRHRCGCADNADQHSLVEHQRRLMLKAVDDDPAFVVPDHWYSGLLRGERR